LEASGLNSIFAFTFRLEQHLFFYFSMAALAICPAQISPSHVLLTLMNLDKGATQWLTVAGQLLGKRSLHCIRIHGRRRNQLFQVAL